MNYSNLSGVLDAIDIQIGKFSFLFYINVNLNVKNAIQYSVPSIAEMVMTSSGPGYEQHLTNPLTTIRKKKKEYIKEKKKD